jgi:hypothetical protein
LFTEIVVALLLSYVRPLNVGFNTRQLACPHFMIPAFDNFVKILLFDETRKIFMRNGTKVVNNKPKYFGWIARNTYW